MKAINLRSLAKKRITALVMCLWCVLTTSAYAQSGYVSVDGAKLYYQTIGKGTPVIMLHGGPGLDHTYFLPQMRKIGEKHQAVFYDQRGSGKSESTSLDSKDININQFVQDLEHLRQALGYEKVTVLGHSWGGLLAMNYAIKYPEHTKALILMNSAPATMGGWTAFEKEFGP